MREIEFRAWHKENRIMITVRRLDFMINADNTPRQDCNGYYDDNLPIHFGLHEIELMQFTGLHDRNKNETYKDDIIERSNGERGVIIWREEMACFDVKFSDGNSFPLAQVMSDSRVIGNIHANPDLLKP